MLVWFFSITLLLLTTVDAQQEDSQFHAKRHLPHRLGRSAHRSRHARFASNLTGVSQRSLNRRATLPTGWSVLTASGNDGAGCYEDTGSVRVLSNKFNGYADVGRCLQQCQSAGFQYAGMEYGSECWCSSSLPSKLVNAPASACKYKCPGTDDACGGYYRVNLFSYAAPPKAAWRVQGCVQDGPARLLTGYNFASSQMTVDRCTAACESKGYSLAGLEVGTQCYCGSELANGLGANLDASKCGYGCSGGGSNCGGSWTMTLYTTAPALPASPPAAPAVAPQGWTYQGCHSDGSPRTLSVQMTKGVNSVTECLTQCQTLGYAFGGVQYRYQCWCGGSINPAAAQIDEAKCSMPCNAGGLGCGGNYAISMWSFDKSAAVALPSSSISTVVSKTSTLSISTVASTSSTASPTSTASPAGWTYLYCAIDGNARALGGANYLDTSGMTVAKCLDFCRSKGMSLGGVQTGSECWCGNSLQNGLGGKSDESSCASTCTGDSTAKTRCGGAWRISLWTILSGQALSIALGQTTSSSLTTSSTVLATTPSSTPAAQPTPAGYLPTNAVPSSSSQKYIWAHVIMGNTYPYSYNTWMDDVRMASASGIDGFVLNLGSDSWQPARVQDAYNAARDSGTGFKMMLSFDMAEFSCYDWTNVPLFKQYLDKYMNHPAAAKVEGRTAVTTFSGSDCTFGQGNANAGWNAVFGGYRGGIYFMPAYNADPMRLGSFDIQADVNWGSAWPSNGQDIEMSRDSWFMQQLSPSGKKYVGTLSPGFFTHFSYKNWLWRGDDWLFAQRWEDLISMRGSIDQIEILSWNDYGESSHVGPVKGDMPPEAKLYATNSLPHEDVLSLNAFYAQAWKTGKYPTITQDKVWVMARPHPANANAWGDNLGPPQHRDWTQDNFYAQVHLMGPANVQLCSGGNCRTFAGAAGINRFAQAMSAGQGIRVTVMRNGQTMVDLRPDFVFDGNPQRYNFNYLIESS